MQKRAVVYLSKGREDSVKRFHPWVFSGAIDRVDGKVVDGDMVDLTDYKGNYLATGIAGTGSIAVKILWFGPRFLPEDFIFQKLSRALELRRRLGFEDNAESNAYRLCFSEADGLPGLIVDYYNGVAVVQAHSTGIFILRHEIADALRTLYGNRLVAVYDKSKETLAKSGYSSDGNSFLYGNVEDVTIKENNHLFLIDFKEGQKTGFFLDQRDNRFLLGKYSKGRKVLNVFSYSGGFSIYALNSGATHVTSLDASQRAMDTLEKNLELNNISKSNHESVVADAKIWLPQMEGDFDIVVLDPPAFAKRQADRHKAIQGYKFINATAIRKIKQGGLLFTFSCSQAISNEQFTSMVMASALEAGRDVKILHHLGHSADHPISIFHPEGEYLKGLVLSVS